MPKPAIRFPRRPHRHVDLRPTTVRLSTRVEVVRAIDGTVKDTKNLHVAARRDQVGHPIVTVQQHADRRVLAVSIADFGTLSKNLSLHVDRAHRAIRGLFAMLSDVVGDLLEPALRRVEGQRTICRA